MERFFKQTLGLGYYRSVHRAEYDRIGDMTDVSPVRVYQLSHGRHSRSEKDRTVKKALAKEGMLWTE